MQPHHRRRRIVASLAVGAVVVSGGLVAASRLAPRGSVGHRLAVRDARGFFTRLHGLSATGKHSLAVNQQVAENAAIDRTLRYTPYVRIAGSQHREVALTFDDGPGPFTPQILAILERTHVSATFFEVGIQETYFHASTAAIVAHGYTIGDHTELHSPMSKLSAAGQRAQLLEDARRVGQYGAPFPRLFRPPFGLWNRTTLKLLRRYRMLMVLWTVDTSDYRERGVKAIVNAALSGARPGAIILLHDAGGNRLETVKALPLIIKKLRARGYEMVTVPRLLLDNPAPRKQGFAALLGPGG